MIHSDTLYLTNTLVQPALSSEISTVEKELGIQFPSDYVGLVSRLGGGTLDGFVRILAPAEVLNRLASVRDRWLEFAAGRTIIGDDYASYLSVAQAERGVSLFDTIDGDEGMYQPGESHRFLVVPRHRLDIPIAGSTFAEAIAWCVAPGNLLGPYEILRLSPSGEFIIARFHYFTPDINCITSGFGDITGVTTEQVREFLMSFALEHRDDVICIERRTVSEGGTTETELLQLFIRDFQGMVTYTPTFHEPDAVAIFIHHGPDPQGELWHTILAYCRRIAGFSY